MDHELLTVDDTDDLATVAARWVATHLTQAVDRSGTATMAVSGGTTPWAMFTVLATMAVPWDRLTLFQVDERIAPDGDPARNLTHLLAALGDRPAHVVPMPVAEPDAVRAAATYQALLPERFDLVHLGLGADGHTASLVPGDPVVDVTDRLVAVTGPYQGHRRMTLTRPALARAGQLLWLVAGADKASALHRLLTGDRGIPAGLVEAGRSTVLADTRAVQAVAG